MSCEECRCDDLKRIRKNLEKINKAYDKVCAQYAALKDCGNKVDAMGELQVNMFEADNRFEVKRASRQLFDKIEPRLDLLKSGIASEKSSLEEYESRLSKEDHEYHEAERRSRERAAEEERHRANAARAAVGR